MLPGRGLRSGEVELGRVSGVFGVRGEVRLYLHNRDSVLLEPGGMPVVLVSPEGRREAAVLEARPGAGRRILGRIHGVTDPETARAYQEWRVAIRVGDLPELEPGEFWHWQVEGLPAWHRGAEVGVVEAVHDTDGGQVFEIRTDRGTTWVPAVRSAVRELDLEAGRLVLEPGILDRDEG